MKKKRINRLNIDTNAKEELIHILESSSSESSDIDELSTNDSDYHSTTESNYAIKINLQ